MKDAEDQEGVGNRPLFFSSLVVRRLVMRDDFLATKEPSTPPPSDTTRVEQSNDWKTAAVTAIEIYTKLKKEGDSSKENRA